MKTDNVVAEKSMKFAIRIVNCYNYLRNEKQEFVMAKQILRSGTSIGANIKESVYGESKADFIHKLRIALKEASETEYWLDLLFQTKYIEKKEYESLATDCVELIKLLTSIIKTNCNK